MKNDTKFHWSSFPWHRFGTTFTVAEFQKGLPDFSESLIKSSFLLMNEAVKNFVSMGKNLF